MVVIVSGGAGVSLLAAVAREDENDDANVL